MVLHASSGGSMGVCRRAMVAVCQSACSFEWRKDCLGAVRSLQIADLKSPQLEAKNT